MSENLLNIQIIPYELGGDALFERIRGLPAPVFLDTNSNRENPDGFDILAADPIIRLQTRGGETEIITSKLELRSTDCPFSLLRQQLQEYSPASNTLGLPFTGGAIGYFGYDLARRVECLPENKTQDIDIPEMDIGIYLWALIRDHKQRQAYFVSRPELAASERDKVLTLINEPAPIVEGDFRVDAEFTSNLSAAEYAARLKRILDYIVAGDCYQVNFAQRFEAPYEGDEWQAYRRLKEVTDAPFSAFQQREDYALLSLSPERFVQVRDGGVETKPIKGTRPRGCDPEQDQQYARLLRNSTKDQAENLMIVDLLRNDISKNCASGSVSVPELFDIESYSNVHHLVSTVRGQLSDGRDAIDLLRGCFPGGSITGAPKLRAMEIIEELEPQRRSAYCGSIGYIDFNGNMDTNIAIRTLVCHHGQIYCWGGGGIVADSDIDNEYQESYVKVSNLLNTLGAVKGL